MKNPKEIIVPVLLIVLIVGYSYSHSTKNQASSTSNSSSQVNHKASLDPFTLYQMASSFTFDNNSTPQTNYTNTVLSVSNCLNVQRVHIPNYIHNAVIVNRGNEAISVETNSSANPTNVPGIHISKYITKRIADK